MFRGVKAQFQSAAAAEPSGLLSLALLGMAVVLVVLALTDAPLLKAAALAWVVLP